jgi:uncharacterized protein YdaU (DUF1376 family)
MSETRPDTWMPLYVADYLADTTRLTTVQHGAYLLLIMAYWRAGEALPDDDEDLAAMTRLALKDWQKIRPKIAGFFTVAAGRWTHNRIEREIERATINREQKSAAGKASATARASQRNSNGRSTGVGTDVATEPQRNVNSSSSSSPSSPSHPSDAQGESAPPSAAPPPAEKPPSKAKGSRLTSDWTLPEDWAEWATTELLPLGGGLPAILAYVDTAALRFRDHWLGKAGKDGVKLDWQATWRNWIRGDIERGKTPKGASNGKADAAGPGSSPDYVTRVMERQRARFGPGGPGGAGADAGPVLPAASGGQ